MCLDEAEMEFFSRMEQQALEQIKELKKMGETSQSSLIVCRYCQKATVDHIERQLRAADEGMTTICECRSCSKVYVL